MIEETTSLEDCAEHMNEALGPLDAAQRALHVMIPAARGLNDPRLGELEELLAEVARVQHTVALLRTRFDDAS